MTNKEIISRNIDKRRVEQGLSQFGLAKKIGSHQSIVFKWCNAESTPNSIYLYKLAKALDCTMEDLMEGVEV